MKNPAKKLAAMMLMAGSTSPAFSYDVGVQVHGLSHHFESRPSVANVPRICGIMIHRNKNWVKKMTIIQVTEVREGPFVDDGDKMVRSTIEEVFMIDTDKIPAFVADAEADGAWRMSFVQTIIDDAMSGESYVTRDIAETFTDGVAWRIVGDVTFRDIWYEEIYADEGAEPDIMVEVQIEPY